MTETEKLIILALQNFKGVRFFKKAEFQKLFIPLLIEYIEIAYEQGYYKKNLDAVIVRTFKKFSELKTAGKTKEHIDIKVLLSKWLMIAYNSGLKNHK